MTAAFSIILPHKRNPGNDRALSICLDMLMANTVNDFILLMDAADNQPLYPRVNALFEQATTDCCVYWASDMFASPGWDVPMLELWNDHTIVTNTVVEPGVISMHGGNHKMDFGRKPDTFNRAAFEAWCAGGGHVAGGEGWYAPYMISRTGFWAMGGLDLNVDAGLEFGGADMALFAQWKANGNRVVRAPGSWAYHLQRWSDVDEQTAEKRN
jgi:hypothetical protein